LTSSLKTEAFRIRDSGDCSYFKRWRIAFEKKSKFTEVQNVFALKKSDAGVRVEEI
jgi:hypothetical protein